MVDSLGDDGVNREPVVTTGAAMLVNREACGFASSLRVSLTSASLGLAANIDGASAALLNREPLVNRLCFGASVFPNNDF